MLKNYLKNTLSSIGKHRMFSLLNVLGLSVGMACFIVILLYVQNEISYDRFHKNKNRIYRILRVSQIEGKTDTSYHVPGPLASSLAQEFPEIVGYSRLERLGKITVTHEGNSFVEDQFILADPAFFQMFTFPLVLGDPDHALNDKFAVVITEQAATRYFGDENPVGKILTLDNRIDLKVTGIAEDVPHNTDFQFSLISPFPLINDIAGYDYLSSWNAFNFESFVMTQQNFSLAEFEQKSLSFCKKYRPNDPPDYQHLKSLTLEPLPAIHLTANLKLYIYTFSAIAVIILVLACINYMNLAVVQSTSRIREVGIRKVIGATRLQIVTQFLGESIILSFLSLPIALLIVEFVLKMYNRLFSLHLNIQYIQNWSFSLGLLGIAFIVGIISGIYPAIITSIKQPVLSLRQSFHSGFARSTFGNILIVFQFSAAIILLMITIIIHIQLNFIQDKNLGFNKENIINVTMYDNDLRQQWKTFKTELLMNPNVLSVSGNDFLGMEWNNSIQWEGMAEDEQMQMRFFVADADFLPTFQIELLTGRNFRNNTSEDQGKAYLLNESAIKALGWEPASAIGKQFRVWMAGNELGSVVGVVKDFHFQSLRNLLKPLAIEMGTSFNVLSIKVKPENIQQTIRFIKNTARKISPHAPFEYYFVDSEIDQMYKLEMQLRQIFIHFSALSILIACLGLLGLTSFSIVNRTKEIGIRKVFGASVLRITALLSNEFTKWVILANIVAWPIAWYAMNKWLQNFAYRIEMRWWMFALAGGMALVIALLTVSWQAIRAATANPVESLRYE
jgi:putative ABC transport system permease protein